MQVNKTLETENGTVTFEGELTQEEADMVIKVGLNTLLQQGYLPFVHEGGIPPVEDMQ